MNKTDLEKEFLEMVHTNKGIIYKVISFYVDEYSSWEDLYQDVILNLWKSFPNFKKESLLSTWIYRITLNTCISFFRKDKKKPIHVELSIDVKEYCEDDEDIQELYNLIGKLGKLDRALILLYLEDRPYKEIGEIMGITPTNVSTKISRIKEKLKQMSNY